MFGWIGLGLELRRWRQAGRRPRLWWRDDDARTPTPQLRRLIAQAMRAGTPLFLGVIPEGLNPALFDVLARYPNVAVLQHGCRHVNRGGYPASEFAPDALSEVVAAELAAGWRALGGFPRRLPVYVAPWNCLTPNVEAALAQVGYAAVSAWGNAPGATRVDAHVDLLRWRPVPRFAGRERVLGRLRRELQRRRRAGLWEEPIGLLTHHLVHDEETWRFLDQLLLFRPLEMSADWPEGPALFGCTFAAAPGHGASAPDSSAA